MLDDGPASSFHIASSSDFPFEQFGVDAALIERHALYVEPRDEQLATAPPATAPPFVALGHRAIGHALRDHGRTRFWRLAGAILLHPLMRAPASIVYRLVADNRATVSGWAVAVVKLRNRD
ncbi:hypothetical protein ACFWGD_02335 [Corynebacterium sp. NPDC060344]|uniref:hypothetical protein n=1 Tax=Corynebacterium sp. NPDC060344 TaxID=3347101 RepID=UPI003651936F